MAKVSIRLSEDPEAHTWSVEERINEDEWQSMLTTSDVGAAVLMLDGMLTRTVLITSTNAIIDALDRIAERMPKPRRLHKDLLPR